MKLFVGKDGTIKLPPKARKLFSDYVAFCIKDGFVSIRSAKADDRWNEDKERKDLLFLDTLENIAQQ